MIFVTVGTHEQQFDRLVEYMDNWAENHEEDVVIQTGYSNYCPHNAIWERIFPYDEMISNVKNARIIISHGGPSTFLLPLQMGKKPIIVPRRMEYGEHINNHQLEFCNILCNLNNSIIVVNELSELGEILEDYDSGILNNGYVSNNKEFNVSFERVVRELFK